MKLLYQSFQSVLYVRTYDSFTVKAIKLRIIWCRCNKLNYINYKALINILAISQNYVFCHDWRISKMDSKYFHIRLTIRRRLVTMTFRAHRTRMRALSRSRSLVLFIRKIYYLPRGSHTMCHESGTKKQGYVNVLPVRTWQSLFFDHQTY